MKFSIYRVVLAICIALVVGFIFFNSTRNGEQSSGMSQGVSEVVAQIVVPDFDQMQDPTKTQTVNRVHFAVRNVAHALEFGALGFFVALLLLTFKFNYGKYLIPIILTIFSCFTVAVCDEFLQGSINGRAADINDVWMDMLGVATFIVCAVIFDGIITIIKKRRRLVYGKR